MGCKDTFFELEWIWLEVHGLQHIAPETVHHWQSLSKQLEDNASDEHDC